MIKGGVTRKKYAKFLKSSIIKEKEKISNYMDDIFFTLIIQT